MDQCVNMKKETFSSFQGPQKLLSPRFPTELLPFIFITLQFLFPGFPDNGADKKTIYNSLLTAGHYLITTSGSHIVCWRLFKVLDGRRRNGETYNPGWAVARTGSQVPCSKMALLRTLAFDISVSMTKGGDEVSPLKHILERAGGSTTLNRVIIHPDKTPKFYRAIN